ncbi:hypothetical protein OS493_038164 [Desmophyllum pertusum]|uniref:Uncharacterized protein n=1 Tax=Desmophyllum pertusum TaxID=174260 RepID=A0A9W9YHI3_9CNID|nr:hypothetical protein OS493_038164 [Desmophyllum pertusum]
MAFLVRRTVQGSIFREQHIVLPAAYRENMIDMSVATKDSREETHQGGKHPILALPMKCDKDQDTILERTDFNATTTYSRLWTAVPNEQQVQPLCFVFAEQDQPHCR